MYRTHIGRRLIPHLRICRDRIFQHEDEMTIVLILIALMILCSGIMVWLISKAEKIDESPFIFPKHHTWRLKNGRWVDESENRIVSLDHGNARKLYNPWSLLK